VGLERGPLSLMSTTEELLGRKSSGSGQVRFSGRAVTPNLLENTHFSMERRMRIMN
jgi:hypothetical protein